MRGKLLKLGLAGLSTLSFQTVRSVGLKAEEQTDLENKMHMDSKLVEQIPKLPRQNNLSDNQNLFYKNQNTSDNQNDKKTGNGKREALRSGECILVVGTTGTGKSSTISKYTGEKIFVSDKSTSATRSCMSVSDSRGPDYPVWVDTIGYDDSFYLTDSDSFKQLLRFLQDQRLLKVRAIVWTVVSQERKDARLRKQAEFINQFKDVDIWDNVIILVKQPGSYNLNQASQGAHEAAKYYAGEMSQHQVLGFTYLDEKIPEATLEKLRSLSPLERADRLLVTDEELVEHLDRALGNIDHPVQIIFEDRQCTACGVIGDERLLPDFCHLEQGFVHKRQLKNFHPEPIESFHPLAVDASHPGVLRLTGGPNGTCESVRNVLGGAALLSSLVDPLTGGLAAVATGSAHLLCNSLNKPYAELYSCCSGESFRPGCKVQHPCCKREEGTRGCTYRYACCLGAPQAAGCTRRYDCCGREESATGCESICKKCGFAWGTIAANCYRTNHQLIRYTPDRGN